MATPMLSKTGRPREYTLAPLSDIPDVEVGLMAAMLGELRERVIDQVVDLPLEALTFRPDGTTLSIGVLVIHLVWAEAGWIKTVTDCDVPAALRDDIHTIGQALPAGAVPPETTMGASELVKMCRRIADEVTIPALASFNKSLNTVIHNDRVMTPKGVLLHLIWHWTYHSGQIGLLREQWGANYTWTFGTLGA